MVTESEREQGIRVKDMDDKEKEEYSFVRETIKEKPVNKSKLFRRTVITASCAVLFGLVACLTFLLIEPVINNILNPEKISKVEFPEEEQEVSPEQLLTEETVAEQEQAKQQAAQEAAKEEAKQEVAQEITLPDLTIESYEKLYEEFYSLAKASEKYMTTVIGISEKEDWFQGTFENENTSAGLIVANKSAEILILADINSMQNAKEYHVRFCDKQLVKADLKKKDTQTGMAIFAVNLSDMKDTTKDAVEIATLGSSSDDSIVGKPVIAIGAPLGTSGSLAYGMITSNGSHMNLTDAIYSVLMTDISRGTSASGVIINMKGEVLGIIAGSANSAAQSMTISTLGVSELKALIAKLSNGENRAYIGVRGMDVTDEAHSETGVPYGAYVSEVLSQSPAMKSGILNGDVIVQIGDHTISSFREYRTVVLSLAPQTIVNVKIMRYDGTQYNSVDIELTTGEAE